MKLVLDIEADALEPTSVKNVWCVVTRDVDTDAVKIFKTPKDYESLGHHLSGATSIIGHNCIAYDAVVLAHVLDIHIPIHQLEDTLILSHLHNYPREGGHSLEALGRLLKIEKFGTDITDWSYFQPRMVERCIQDTYINKKLYVIAKEKLKNVPDQAIRIEHEIASICLGMHRDGFAFDRDGCVGIILELRERLAEIDVEMQEAFPPEIIHLKTKDKVIPFNPRSPSQIVKRLNEWGWKPTDYTPNKNPKVNETNLATLPADAPRASRLLIERLILSTRVSTLESWLSAYSGQTGRIHGDYRPIGTWTHRMSHRNPNMGNVAAEKSIKYRSPELIELATELGAKLRGLWRAGDDCFLVGTDADQIQLRIFAHYVNDPALTKALTEGSSKLGTDFHTLNSRILSVTRDSAKTFIYAFLLGAGNRKLGEILGTDREGGARTKERFIGAYPGLKYLRERIIPSDAGNGYFRGLDGRYVRIPGETQRDREHLALAGYLQNGEAVVMKHANVLWRKELDEDVVPYRQVNFVHDEWQTEAMGTREVADHIGCIQASSITRTGEALCLRCPMAGNYKIGKTWLETH